MISTISLFGCYHSVYASEYLLILAIIIVIFSELLACTKLNFKKFQDSNHNPTLFDVLTSFYLSQREAVRLLKLRLSHFPVDLTGNLITIEKLVLGGIWTGDLPIFNPDTLASAPSRHIYKTWSFEMFLQESVCITSDVRKEQPRSKSGSPSLADGKATIAEICWIIYVASTGEI